jgi:DeoR family transcriptional regulator of aga operon
MSEAPKVQAPRLLAEERRRQILKVLDQNGRITVEEVAQRFGVSYVTARADLDALAEIGSLIRSHGGGIKPLAPPEHPLRARESMRRDEKIRIAEAAMQLIRPYQTVILCSGSTLAELASQIGKNRAEQITVITHALNIASQLAGLPNLNLVMIGGIIRQSSTAAVGPHAEQMFHSLHADHCFMSTVGLDADLGITTLDIMEAHLNLRMIQNAAQVTVLADSSKFGHRSLSLISDFRTVHRVITDAAAPAAQVEKLRTRGVEVVLV